MYLCPSTHILHEKPGTTPVTAEDFIPTLCAPLSDPAALVEKVAKVVQKHVGYFNGWAVSQENETKNCRAAAKEIARLYGVPASMLRSKLLKARTTKKAPVESTVTIQELRKHYT